MANNVKNGQGDPRTSEVNQSFSPNMSYKPKVSNSPAFRAADMSYSPDIANQPFAGNTKEAAIFPIIKMDNNMKNGQGNNMTNGQGKPERKAGANEVDMSYTPKVFHNPQAIISNGTVNQAFGADMSYSPDIETGADKIVTKPQSPDKNTKKTEADKIVKNTKETGADKSVKKPRS